VYTVVAAPSVLYSDSTIKTLSAFVWVYSYVLEAWQHWLLHEYLLYYPKAEGHFLIQLTLISQTKVMEMVHTIQSQL